MSLMLVNPRKRKAARSPAQKAATRRMLAANRGKRHSNPKSRRSSAAAKRHHNPIRSRIKHVYHRAKRRSNPSLRGMTGGATGMLMNGLKGAGGAIVVNVITNYLPAAVKTGNVVYATRAAIAILIGTVGKKVLGNNARVMAEGALTVNIHDFINSMAGAMLPGSTLHGVNGVGEYVQGQLPVAGGGTMIDTELHGMGEYLYR